MFYMDESGEREYTSTSRYFVLCTIGVMVSDWKNINSSILALKKTYFNDVQVEIKSNWLRIPKERDKYYLKPYKISTVELTEFTEKLYDILSSYKIVVIAGVVDKEQMKKQYKTPQSPSSLAYRLVLERIELFLQRRENEYGFLVFDKITELELQKKGYEDLLSKQHARYLEKGTDYMPINHIVEGLLLIPSHENNMLQLVDICAYNVLRQFRDYGDGWNPRTGFSGYYSYFQRIIPLLDCQPDGNYVNWGIKKFP